MGNECQACEAAQKVDVIPNLAHTRKGPVLPEQHEDLRFSTVHNTSKNACDHLVYIQDDKTRQSVEPRMKSNFRLNYLMLPTVDLRQERKILIPLHSRLCRP